MARVVKRTPKPTAYARATSKPKKCKASCRLKCKYSIKNQHALCCKSCGEITGKGKRVFQLASKVKGTIKLRIVKDTCHYAQELTAYQ
eukprot:NP_001177961.1 cysteine-rich perinuclear theca 14 [Mus musculus]